jgi:predicted nucleotidyltransferase
MSILAQILSSQVRAEIFGLLFDGQKASIHLRDLQRRSGLSIGTIQKEIAHLKKMDLVVPLRDGNRLYYSANGDHPLYKDISSMVEKTTGITQKLKEALSTIPAVECAFVFGSYAKGEEKSHSDIDLMVIGSTSLRALSIKLSALTNKFEREINPHIISKKAWKEKLQKKDHFLRNVLSEKKIFLIGDENALG